MKLEFVVAGRPNKGKSSLVACLARDDQVAISAQSRTTIRSERFEFTAGEESLVLIDTPGFQRPGKVLAWLQARAAQTGAGADQRAQVVHEFIADPANQQAFPDEVDVLRSIVGGENRAGAAAIIYIVDGSVPYDPDYEAEMSILQWAGRLSIAIINPIEHDRYVAQWQAALNQFFKLVRVFNAHLDDVATQIRLFEDLAHVDPAWQPPIERIIDAIRQLSHDQARISAEIAADLLDEACRFRLERKMVTKQAAEQLRGLLQQSFEKQLRAMEKTALDELQKVYGHDRITREGRPLTIPGDLFDTREWALWGLDRKRLMLAMAGAGAAAGAGLDLITGGISMGAALTTGAVLGGASAWLGADQLAKLQTRLLPSGMYLAVQGPITNPNFPYVLLGRLLYAQRALRNRSHARRDALKIEGMDAAAGYLASEIDRLAPGQQKALHRAMQDLVKQRPVEDLFNRLEPLFEPSRQ